MLHTDPLGLYLPRVTLRVVPDERTRDDRRDPRQDTPRGFVWPVNAPPYVLRRRQDGTLARYPLLQEIR